MPVKLEHILKRVQALPALPASAMRVIALTKNPETNIKDLQAVIAQDPALAAGILRQANSSYYGYARRISSLQDGIMILGFQAIQGLAMASAVAPILKVNLAGYEIDQEGLWQHSMLTAMTAKKLCKILKLPHGDTAFTAGLLHDIGKIIITVYLQEIGSYILKKINDSSLTYAELEEKVIGFGHATVGGFIAKHWNLPPELVSAISYHHTLPSEDPHPDVTAVVHIANSLANTMGVGGGVDSFLNPLEEKALARFQLTEADLELLMAEMGELLSDPSLFG
ncbi:HDOD domain-containing protein [Paradesulfitobacterium ferrireducens]|uniref:HDOD domain-containing protein n=1 Tax=Paradesulfitobacterium ferrireducens TaxID=2816476 RepID=UPI001A8F5057|nr:HDOD domain-containing protein [Paradesulfitobacterium ferrireducens]